MTHVTPRNQPVGSTDGSEFGNAGDGLAADRLAQGNTAAGRPRRLSTETKAAFKTTELWLYIVILTVGYLVSRGFARSGSRQLYDG